MVFPQQPIRWPRLRKISRDFPTIAYILWLLVNAYYPLALSGECWGFDLIGETLYRDRCANGGEDFLTVGLSDRSSGLFYDPRNMVIRPMGLSELMYASLV